MLVFFNILIFEKANYTFNALYLGNKSRSRQTESRRDYVAFTSPTELLTVNETLFF